MVNEPIKFDPGLTAKFTPSSALAQHTTPEAVADDIERLFRVLAEQAGAGVGSALRRLRMLHQAIIDREEQGDRLARMLPGGIAEKLRRETPRPTPAPPRARGTSTCTSSCRATGRRSPSPGSS